MKETNLNALQGANGCEMVYIYQLRKNEPLYGIKRVFRGFISSLVGYQIQPYLISHYFKLIGIPNKNKASYGGFEK